MIQSTRLRTLAVIRADVISLPRAGRTWDCVFLHDELDLLELRLELLDAVVDRVLVVEGDRTFDGTPKASSYLRHANRFVRWSSKITHRMAPLPERAGRTAWDLENIQRSHLRTVLIEVVTDDDLLLVGDIDEVPDPELVGLLPTLVEEEPLRLLMEHMIFHANWRALTTWDRRYVWDDGPLAFRLQHLESPMVRVVLGDPHEEWDGFVQHQLASAGIHLSWLGGLAAIDRKLDITSQQEWNRAEVRDAAHLEGCLAHRIHFQGWPLEVVPEPSLHPLARTLLQSHPELFDFGRPPPQSARRAFLAYTWLRNRGYLPAPVRYVLGNHPSLVTGIGRPLFLGADAVLQATRRRHLRSPYWKSPVDVAWPGAPNPPRFGPSGIGPY